MDENEKILEPLLDIQSVLPLLNKISIFGGLDENELYVLFHQLKIVKYKENELIFRQGTAGKYIYIIKEGQVRLFMEEEGISYELIEFGQGNCFGETSLIGIQPHSASAVSVVNTELLVLSSRSLHEFYKSNGTLFSKVILNIARETCRRLSRTDNTILHYILGKNDTV